VESRFNSNNKEKKNAEAKLKAYGSDEVAREYLKRALGEVTSKEEPLRVIVYRVIDLLKQLEGE